MERAQSRMNVAERNSHEPHVYAERTVPVGMSITLRREKVTSVEACEFRPVAMFWEEGCRFHSMGFSLRQNTKEPPKVPRILQIASDSQALITARVSSSRTFLPKGVSCSSMDQSTQS